MPLTLKSDNSSAQSLPQSVRRKRIFILAILVLTNTKETHHDHFRSGAGCMLPTK